MAKRATTKQQQTHSWAVYHIKGTPAKLVAIVDAPGQTAVAGDRGRECAAQRAAG